MTASEPLIQHKRDPMHVDVDVARRRAAREFGKSSLAQRLEVLRLRRTFPKLKEEEYYAYRLFDDARHSYAEKAQFLGISRQMQIIHKCIPHPYFAVADDKLTFQTLMMAHGLPIAPIVALYHAFRPMPGARPIPSRDELLNYLRTAEYPLFGKPVTGMFSEGTIRLDRYDAATDELIPSAGARITVDAFADSIRQYMRRGYIFQEVQHPHPDVRTLTGDRLATFRLVVLMSASGPEMFRTLWKIPTGEHVADNYWRHGNILAAIDASTGRITRAVSGKGFEQEHLTLHPDTGLELIGYEIPGWQAILDTCLEAAKVMPRITMQAWDVAMCEQGPVLIEVNLGGGFILPQMAFDAGLLDEQFRQFLRRFKYDV